MLLLILAYLGGVLTILSPCTLPVLPFVFARADRPFARNGLPMLAGMVLTFAAVATLAALGGGWAVHANQYGRIVALAALSVLGLTLLSNRVAEWITHPFVTLGNRLTERSGSESDSVLSAVGLGVAAGLLWAPCADPILGLLLTGAALNGASLKTTFLLLTYAAGAATSLALALLIGGRVFAAMKRSPGAGELVRRTLGVLVLAGVAAIALGLDTHLLTRVSLASTGGIEQKLIDAVHLIGPVQLAARATGALPYVCGWADKYKDHGLVVIGVHAPVFAFEKDPRNVTQAYAFTQAPAGRLAVFWVEPTIDRPGQRASQRPFMFSVAGRLPAGV